MEAFASRIEENQVLEVELGINLTLSSGFAVDEVSPGIRSLRLITLKGEITAIDDDFIFIKENDTDFIYKISLETLLQTSLESENFDLLNIVLNTINLRRDSYTDTLSPSQIGNRASDIAAYAYEIPKKVDASEDLFNYMSAKKLVIQYCPEVFFDFYITNYDSKTKARDIFEDLVQDIVPSLLGTDGHGMLLESYEKIISTLNDELRADYDEDTLGALNAIRSLVINLAEKIYPHVQSTDLVPGTRLYAILSSNINVNAYHYKENDFSTDTISILEGVIIKSEKSRFVIAQKDTLMEVNRFEYLMGLDKKISITLQEAKSSTKEFLNYIKHYLPYLNLKDIKGIIHEVIEDTMYLMDSNTFEIFLFIENLIKKNKNEDALNFINYLTN